MNAEHWWYRKAKEYGFEVPRHHVPEEIRAKIRRLELDATVAMVKLKELTDGKRVEYVNVGMPRRSGRIVGIFQDPHGPNAFSTHRKGNIVNVLFDNDPRGPEWTNPKYLNSIPEEE